MDIIGKVSASEKHPATVDEFYFWLKDNIVVKPFDIVKVSSFKNSKTYGIIEEIVHITDSNGHISSYVSSDFGDVNSTPETLRLGLTYVKCKVLANVPRKQGDEQIYMPIQDGQSVSFCTEEDILNALGLKNIKNPVPAGLIQMSNRICVPISFNGDFLLGSDGAHFNISGISGLATKTSYTMFLLQALQQIKKDDISIIVLNVKKSDLLRLDEENPEISESTNDDYKTCELTCKAFENVTYYYPYQKRREKQFSHTYLDKETVEEQHRQNKSFNYIYTYEESAGQLDMLFSNIDDPTHTMESILTHIMESPEFQGLTWDSFKDKLKMNTSTSTTSRSKDIPIQSWRKFKRLINKSINKDFFVESMGNTEKRQVFLKNRIAEIKKGEVTVVDIARLDEQMQCFVFGDIVNSVYELKLGDTERDEADIPKHIIIFVDELNKYASSTSPKNSPILSKILEITERGRSNGIVLFAAEQFRSAIHDRVKGNCSTNAYGRTNAIEISKPDYRFIPKVFSNMMTRLSKGELIIEHPIFRTLLKVKFPRPSYKQDE